MSTEPDHKKSNLRQNDAGSHPLCGVSSVDAFTLIELLVSMAILVLIVAMLITMVNATSKTWKNTAGKIEEFRDARVAFDTITRRLSQATLNTYLDYVTNSSGAPTDYIRQSELRFLCGQLTNNASFGNQRTIFSSQLQTTNPSMAVFFQAPNGFTTNSTNSILQSALNTWGYFIEYGSDSNAVPSFLNPQPTSRNRYRLMELMEPTENLSIYNYTATNRSYTNVDWIANSMTLTSSRPAHVLAENVIALIILPKLSPTDITKWNNQGSNYSISSLTPDYFYDSSINSQTTIAGGGGAAVTDANLNTHNQLPPVVQVTMIAVDETSAIRFPSIYKNLYASNSSAGGINNLFNDNSSPTQFTNDLASLVTAFKKNKMNYRIFTTDVMIKGAKWSSSQKN